MRRTLLSLAIATPALYYGLLAWAPAWLALRVGGWPLSIVCALAAFAILLFVTLLARDDEA